MKPHYLKYLIAGLCAFTMSAAAMATELPAESSSENATTPIVRKSNVAENPMAGELIVVKGDTIPHIIPQKNFGRYDRGLYNYLYIPKGEWSFELTASYGSLKSEDLQLLSVLGNLDFEGSIYSIKPAVSYFIKHNQSVGVRLTYNRGRADLHNMALDIDDDLSFTLHDVSYHSNSFKAGLFYRYYVGLDRSNRFAIFNEISLDYGTGTSRFMRYYNDELYNTRTMSTMASLNFSPGLCVFLQRNLAFNVSFGVFGLKYEHEKQETNGVSDGSRTTSGANFKFNIFNINFGLQLVI